MLKYSIKYVCNYILIIMKARKLDAENVDKLKTFIFHYHLVKQACLKLVKLACFS